MNKKDLKFYEAPLLEVVDLELNASLLAGSSVEGVEDPDDITGGNGGLF